MSTVSGCSKSVGMETMDGHVGGSTKYGVVGDLLRLPQQGQASLSSFRPIHPQCLQNTCMGFEHMPCSAQMISSFVSRLALSLPSATAVVGNEMERLCSQSAAVMRAMSVSASACTCPLPLGVMLSASVIPRWPSHVSYVSLRALGAFQYTSAPYRYVSAISEIMIPGASGVSCMRRTTSTCVSLPYSLNACRWVPLDRSPDSTLPTPM